MPLSSRWTLPIPVCSFPTYLFGPPNSALPDKIAFLDADNPETRNLTFKDFRLWSQRFAAGLRKAGLQPGDRVLLFSGNNLFYPVVVMGVLMAGGIFTGANPGFVARELAYQLADSESKFLLCADESLELAIDTAAINGMGKDRIFIFDSDLIDGTGKSRLGVKNWSTLMAPASVGKNFDWYEPDDPKNTTCCLNYSSGTTGLPKGVEITHYNYVANATQLTHILTLRPDYEERNAKTKQLCFLPMYHAMAQTLFIAVAPTRKVPVYIMKKFDFIKFLEAVQNYKITNLILVPPILVLLVKHPATKNYDLGSVTEVGSGAAPLGAEVIEQAEALWPAGDVKVTQGWGMTEATCSVLGIDPNRDPLPGTVGELNANCQAKLMDSDNKTEVGVNKRGEIWVKGPNVMKGYWRNEKATREVFVDGPDGRWMRTGDIAYVDANGNFFIVDRIKELIKVKGNQVAPAELEALLLDHPKLSDAGVVGVKINGEEVPRAYVVPRVGETPDPKEVAEWTAGRVSRHKRLLGGVVLIDAIPKNPSGKIMRRILREKAMKEVGDKTAAVAKL